MFRIVPILLFILALAPLSGFAQSNPAYTVNDVKVDILAESSVVARNQAFSTAQTQAFKMLAERFLSPEQLAGFTPPDAVTIAGMVSDFEITSEQMSKRRYLGTYLFRFKEGPVYRYFGHGPMGNYEASNVVQGKLLVLPYFSQKQGKSFDNSLWDKKKNPWLEAWQKHASDNNNLVIPSGNISDTMDVRDVLPEKLTRSSLKRIKARYGVNDVALVSASFDPTSKEILSIKIYRTDRGNIEQVNYFPVPKGRAKKLGELLESAVPQVQEMLGGNWKGDTGYNPDILPADTMTNPANVTPPVQGDAYAPQSGHVRALAYFSNINEWLSIRRSLNDIPPLKSVLISSLSTNQAVMEFTYSDWMALTSALSARGLTLRPSGPNQYTLTKSHTTGYTR